VTEFYLESSDIDLVILDKNKEISEMMNHVRHNIEKRPDLFTNVMFLKTAKIPLVKFQDKESGISFDLSFNNEDGIK